MRISMVVVDVDVQALLLLVLIAIAIVSAGQVVLLAAAAVEQAGLEVLPLVVSLIVSRSVRVARLERTEKGACVIYWRLFMFTLLCGGYHSSAAVGSSRGGRWYGSPAARTYIDGNVG